MNITDWSDVWKSDLSTLKINLASGRSRGGPHPLIFRPKWGPKGGKNILGGPVPPSSKGLDDLPPHL